MVNTTALPLGNTTGQRWLVAPVEESGVVISVGSPPAADTVYSPLDVSGVYTIMSSGPQLPPRMDGTSSTTVSGGPPLRATFLMRLSAQNATHCPSVPGSGRARNWLISRTYSCRSGPV
jgi:hypothetical protein